MDVYSYWKAVLKQDETEIRRYFHEDAYVNWHCTNEHFTLDEFIRANCDYPGEWDGVVERVERTDDLIVTAVRVFPKNGLESFHVVSFIRLRGEKIASADEYWADDGEAPQWRRKMSVGTEIR